MSDEDAVARAIAMSLEPLGQDLIAALSKVHVMLTWERVTMLLAGDDKNREAVEAFAALRKQLDDLVALDNEKSRSSVVATTDASGVPLTVTVSTNTESPR